MPDMRSHTYRLTFLKHIEIFSLFSYMKIECGAAMAPNDIATSDDALMVQRSLGYDLI